MLATLAYSIHILQVELGDLPPAFFARTAINKWPIWAAIGLPQPSCLHATIVGTVSFEIRDSILYCGEERCALRFHVFWECQSLKDGSCHDYTKQNHNAWNSSFPKRETTKVSRGSCSRRIVLYSLRPHFCHYRAETTILRHPTSSSSWLDTADTTEVVGLRQFASGLLTILKQPSTGWRYFSRCYYACVCIYIGTYVCMYAGTVPTGAPVYNDENSRCSRSPADRGFGRL